MKHLYTLICLIHEPLTKKGRRKSELDLLEQRNVVLQLFNSSYSDATPMIIFKGKRELKKYNYQMIQQYWQLDNFPQKCPLLVTPLLV